MAKEPNPVVHQGRPAEKRVVVIPPTFERRLKTLVGGRDASAIQAGRVSIIGLDKVKARFGDRWQRVAERAGRIARNTIERYLVPGDIFDVFHQTNYVIVFASLDAEAARVKCLLIADDVMKALLGEDGGEEIIIDTAVMGLDRIEFAADTDTEAPTATPAESEDKRDAAPAHVVNRRNVLDQIRFTYRPIWDRTHDVLSTYLCVPVIATDDADRFREAELEIGDDPEAVARLDYALQQHVLREFTRIEHDGDKFLVTLSVHFATLAVSAQRRRFVQALADGLSREAVRLLVVEIADVPDGVPQSRMVDLVMPLRQHCRAMVARLHIETADLSALRGTGVSAVGCSIAGHAQPELTLMQHMNRFNRAAEKVNIATYIRGLRTVSLAAAAVGAGFRYLDGTGVAKLVERPERIVGYNLMDVYRPVVGG